MHGLLAVANQALENRSTGRVGQGFEELRRGGAHA
jgi:hypothetical protein